MPTVTRSSTLNLNVEDAWNLLQHTDLLQEIAWPLMTYEGDLPMCWRVGQSIDIKPKLLGLIPQGSHFVRVVTINHDTHTIVTYEQSERIAHWNHTMQLTAVEPNRCMYTDTIDIDAGAATYRFAQLFYWHRHRQLCKFLS